jgi:uncharacterized protein (TIGR03437 family)
MCRRKFSKEFKQTAIRRLQTGRLPVLPAIQIGGTPATVTFPGVVSPGLNQINVGVPSAVPAGDAAVVASYSGINSPVGVGLIRIQR